MTSGLDARTLSRVEVLTSLEPFGIPSSSRLSKRRVELLSPKPDAFSPLREFLLIPEPRQRFFKERPPHRAIRFDRVRIKSQNPVFGPAEQTTLLIECRRRRYWSWWRLRWLRGNSIFLIRGYRSSERYVYTGLVCCV